MREHYSPLRISTIYLGLGAGLLWSAMLVQPAVAQPTKSTDAPTDESTSSETRFDSVVERAREAYNQKNWEVAAEAFQRAYDIKQVPNLLYNIGRVYEKAGRLREAVSYYRRFVDQPGINLDHRKDALERIETLKEIVDLEETSSSTDNGSSGPSTDVRRQSNYTWAIVLLSVGGASLGGGTAFSVLTANAHSEFEGATTRSMRRDAADRGRTFGTLADVLLISGGVVTATGIGLAIWPPETRRSTSSQRSPRARLSPVLSSTHAGVRIRIDF